MRGRARSGVRPALHVSLAASLCVVGVLIACGHMSPVARRTSGRSGFPDGIAKPALRALDAAGIRTLAQLARWSETELLALHGMGPKALGMLRGALEAQGKSFAAARRGAAPTSTSAATRGKPGASGSAAVEQFVRDLDHPLKHVVKAVRAAVLRTRHSIGEEIKWNAPSFHHGGHFATLNLRSREHILLVIHAGAKPRPDAGFRRQVPDPTGLVKWLADDRCVVMFASVGDVQQKGAALQRFLDAWIDCMT